MLSSLDALRIYNIPDFRTIESGFVEPMNVPPPKAFWKMFYDHSVATALDVTTSSDAVARQDVVPYLHMFDGGTQYTITVPITCDQSEVVVRKKKHWHAESGSRTTVSGLYRAVAYRLDVEGLVPTVSCLSFSPGSDKAILRTAMVHATDIAGRFGVLFDEQSGRLVLLFRGARIYYRILDFSH